METRIKITPEFLAKRPVSYSSLKAFRKSPKHYVQYLTQPRTTTPAMLLGTVVECLTLEPESFEKRFMVAKKIDQRTKEGKAEYAQMIEKATELNLTLIPEDIYETAKTCKESLYDHPVSRTIIDNRKRMQVQLKWKHKKTGVPVIGYVDFESSAWESDFIIDLKTAQSADPDEFVRQAGNLEYHIQCGAYMDGYPRTQFKYPNMAFLVVETSEPFNVSVFFCDPEYIKRSTDEFHGTMNAFKYCLDNNLFNMGYEFRMFGTREYFNMKLPGYLTQKFETV